MAKKPTVTTISSGYYSQTALNNNFTNIRDQFDNTLSLDGSTPNAMGADLDMNSNDILNVGELDIVGLRINGVLIGAPDVAAAGASLFSDNYTGDGSTVVYAMTYAPYIKDNTQVYVDGVYQNKDTYSITGTSLTFSEAPPLNSPIEIVVARNLLDTLTGDADVIYYNQGGTGAVDTTVGAHLREFVSAKDFGAVGDGIADDTAAINLVEAIGGADLGRGVFNTTLTAFTGDYTGGGSLILASPPRRWSPNRIEGRTLNAPTGFGFTPTIKPIYAGGKWRGDKSVREAVGEPTGTTYFVDWRDGSDGNAGTSEAAPLQSIETALEKSDVGRVKVAPGWYNRLYNWGYASITTTSIISVEPWLIRAGRIVCSTSWSHTRADWTKDTTYDNCYTAARTSVGRVLDTSLAEPWCSNGRAITRYFEYAEATSLSDCNNQPGSWFDSGGTLYLHPIHSNGPDQFPAAYTSADADAVFAPGDNIKVLILESNAFFDVDVGLYVEGVDFVGGNAAFEMSHSVAGHNETVGLHDCGFFYGLDSAQGQGLRVQGGDKQILLSSCTAAWNRRDGFNYHYHSLGGLPNIIEIDCLGIGNGNDDGNINNGSTIHDGINILRIGGLYGHGDGPSVADVGGGDSWNVGVELLPSYRNGTGIQNSTLYNSACDMWAYDIFVPESQSNSMAVTSSGTTYLHNVIHQGTDTENGGSFSEYGQT